jgi:hypothetical protein
MAGCWGYAGAHLWGLLFECEWDALVGILETGELMKNSGFCVRSNYQVSDCHKNEGPRIELTFDRPNPDSGMWRRIRQLIHF